MVKKLKKVLLGIILFIIMLSSFGSVKNDEFISAETIKVIESSYSAKSFVIDTGICGENAWYKIDSNGVLTIGSSGRMNDYDINNMPEWYKDYSSYIKKVIILDGIENIGSNAFFGFSNLSEVYVPRSVKSVGKDAFFACSRFKMYGGHNSFIETYAREYGYEFEINIELFLNSANVNMYLDEKFTLKCTYDKRDTEKNDVLRWFSDNEAIALVDENGCIDAIGEGSAVITAMIDDASISCKVTIEKYDLKNADVVFDQTSYIYDGKEKQPNIKIKKIDKILKLNTDYDVTYENNIQSGQAIVNIIAKGLYKGSIQKTYVIKPAKVEWHKITSTGLTTVLLEWKQDGQVECYSIYRSDKEDGKYEQIYLTEKANITAYEDKNLESGKTYFYKICGETNVKERLVSGEESDIKSVMPTLNAPKLKRIINTTKNSINISWESVEDAQGYIVYRKEIKNEESAFFEKIATINDCKKLNYLDKKALFGKKYCYTVKAYKEKIYGNYDENGITVSMVDNIELKQIKASGGFITCTWDKLDTADGYYIYRKEKSQDKFEKIYTAKKEDTLYTDSDIEEEQEYSYVICAFIKNGDVISVGEIGKNVFSAKSLPKPSYDIKMSDESDVTCTVLAMYFKNTGTKNIRILSDNALLSENETSEFNRSLTLIDYKEYEKNQSINSVKYVDIKPNEETYLMFLVDGYSTYYNMKTYLWFRFDYGGITYVNKSSSKGGASFFEYIKEAQNTTVQKSKTSEKNDVKTNKK